MGLAGYRYSPSRPTPPSPPPRVHLPLPHYRCTDVGCRTEQSNSAVGLKSVAQLTVDGHFSRFKGMTEVYNLSETGNPNDHKHIPGTK